MNNSTGKRVINRATLIAVSGSLVSHGSCRVGNFRKWSNYRSWAPVSPNFRQEELNMKFYLNEALKSLGRNLQSWIVNLPFCLLAWQHALKAAHRDSLQEPRWLKTFPFTTFPKYLSPEGFTLKKNYWCHRKLIMMCTQSEPWTIFKSTGLILSILALSFQILFQYSSPQGLNGACLFLCPVPTTSWIQAMS